MMEGIVFLVASTVFVPVFWIVLLVTIFTYGISKKMWLTGIISIPVSILAYLIALRDHQSLIEYTWKFQILMAITATCISLFLIWIFGSFNPGNKKRG